MESLRNLHHRSIRPKGSFPTIHDDDIVLAKQRKIGKERSTSLVHKMKNLKNRMNKKTASKHGHNNRHSHSSQVNSFDQIPSKDSDIPEEEVVLMDYVDGTFEI